MSEELKCVCGFQAANLAGYKSHQRACNFAGLPLKDQLWMAVEKGVTELDSEIADEAPQIVVMAEQYQTYAMVYSAMKKDKGLVSPRAIEKHLLTVPGKFRDLHREHQALRKYLFGRAPDGKLHKPHPDHPLMKKEEAMEKELKRMFAAALKSVKSQWDTLLDDRLPDVELRNLVALNYELYDAAQTNQGGSNVTK